MRREEDGVRPSVRVGAPWSFVFAGATLALEATTRCFPSNSFELFKFTGGPFKRKCQCQTAYVSRQAGAERVTHSAVTSSNCDRSRLGAHNTPNFSSTLWRWQFGGQHFPLGCAKASTLTGSCLVTRKTTFPGGGAVVHPAPRCVIVWPRARSLARSVNKCLW